MPTEHYKSEEAYRKSRAYTHIHGIPTHAKKVCIGKKCHTVKHSKAKGKKEANYIEKEYMMARKKKSKGNEAIPGPPMGSSRKNMSIGIDEAENGFTVTISGEGKDGYHSKRFVAPHERGAIRIATQHISGMGGGKEKKGKKKGKGKIALAKRG